MTIASDIQGLLRSRSVGLINFSMNGLTVTGHGYAAVADLITQDRGESHPRVLVTPQPNLRSTHGVLGLYNPHYDRLYIESQQAISTPEGQGTVVHECTHAQLDMQRGLSTNERDEEGVAFLAQAWYALQEFGETNVVEEIAEIADHARKEFLRRKRMIRLGNRESAVVRRAVATRFVGYGNGIYIQNGIGNFRYTRPQLWP